MDSGTTTTPGTPQRTRLLANSLLLHLRPARVTLRAIRFTRTFGLGGKAMVLTLLLMASALLMAFVHDPLIRGIHYWSANLLAVEIAGGIVHVDTSKRIRRSSFDPAQVVGGGAAS